MNRARRNARIAYLVVALVATFWVACLNAQTNRPSPPETQADEQPGYQPAEEDSLPLAYQRQLVFYRTTQLRGSIIVNTAEHYLYFVLGNNRALRYGIGVGRDCLGWQGLAKISDKTEWPDWTAPPEIGLPNLPKLVPGGPGNPLGARSMRIGEGSYHIRGTNQPRFIGRAVPSGCFRLVNTDVIHLYMRTPVGTRVIVEQAPEN